ncbi:MAG: nickel-dependent hydrogenase large subunit [Dehalococcoidia bacterium]|jgi:NADH-quinone oxidoreductase subunit D|nr:nickel-dependent hydrogenase large subunit [Dehalococcoidia bacterium]
MKTTIPVGPYHPLIEEPELFRVVVEGERVVDIDWRTSFMHRGVEKIGESKTYDQITFLVERICGICSTSHPLAFCNAVEDLAGVEIPLRAKYIRTIIAELERIHSHLLWLGLAGHYIGYHTIWMWSWKYRELVCDLFERISGNRQSYAMMKPGGVRQDILPSDYPGILSALDVLEPKVNMFIGAVLDDPVILARLKGVGKMSREDAMKRCTVGPVARSAGVDIDIRRDFPYAAYPLVEWKVITQTGGDVFGMAVVRLLETLESIKILRQCVQQIPEGPIIAEIAEVPVGEGIGVEEAPRGECFHYVRSNGTNCPERLKIRAPTYANLPSFRSRFIGERVADIMIILASIDPCYCCTNRVVRIEDGSDVRMLDEKSLLEMSWQRMRELDGGAEHRLRSLLEL